MNSKSSIFSIIFFGTFCWKHASSSDVEMTITGSSCGSFKLKQVLPQMLREKQSSKYTLDLLNTSEVIKGLSCINEVSKTKLKFMYRDHITKNSVEANITGTVENGEKWNCGLLINDDCKADYSFVVKTLSISVRVSEINGSATVSSDSGRSTFNIIAVKQSVRLRFDFGEEITTGSCVDVNSNTSLDLRFWDSITKRIIFTDLYATTNKGTYRCELIQSVGGTHVFTIKPSWPVITSTVPPSTTQSTSTFTKPSTTPPPTSTISITTKYLTTATRSTTTVSTSSTRTTTRRNKTSTVPSSTTQSTSTFTTSSTTPPASSTISKTSLYISLRVSEVNSSATVIKQSSTFNVVAVKQSARVRFDFGADINNGSCTDVNGNNLVLLYWNSATRRTGFTDLYAATHKRSYRCVFDDAKGGTKIFSLKVTWPNVTSTIPPPTTQSTNQLWIPIVASVGVLLILCALTNGYLIYRRKKAKTRTPALPPLPQIPAQNTERVYYTIFEDDEYYSYAYALPRDANATANMVYNIASDK